MNVDWAPGGRQPSDQASRLGLWVRRKFAAIIHIQHRNCYYYSARKLILILPSHKGGRLSRPKHCSKGAQPVPKAVYRSGCRDKHNRPRCDSNLGPLTLQSDVLTTRSRRPHLSTVRFVPEPSTENANFIINSKNSQNLLRIIRNFKNANYS